MTTGYQFRLRQALYHGLVYICAFLSCLVPRYMHTLKISFGLDFSLYTIAVVLTWLIFIRRIRFFKRIECYFFFVWFIVIIGAVWRAKAVGIWGSYVIWISVAILFMQILYKRPYPKTFETVLRAMVDGLFIQLLIGLYEVTAHRYLFEVGTTAERLYGNVAISMFMNLNDYVTFVVTIMPFSIYFFLKTQKKLGKIYYVFIIAASVYLVMKSESRSGYLSLLLIAATCVFLYWKRSKKYRLVIGVLFVSAVVLALSLSYFRTTIQTTASDIVYDQSGRSNYIRINMIKNGFHFLKETYGFGVGAGNLHYWLEKRTVYPVNHILYIHNWYMEIMATFGVLFFLLYFCFHVKCFFSLVRSYRAKKRFWTVNNAFLISFTAFTLVSISSSSNIYSEWVWMYLVLVSTYVLTQTKLKLRPRYQITPSSIERLGRAYEN